MNKGRLFTLLAVAVVVFAASSSPTSANQRQAGNHEQSSAVTPPAIAAETGFVYTADASANSIGVIDLGTGQVNRSRPHLAAQCPGVARWAVAGAIEDSGHPAE